MRIIAGRWRGRSLRAPRGSATRPTSERVREALFAVLGDLTGARVLDLYAGSGALGLEALSRGAAHATFVEPARGARSAILANLEATGATSEATVLGVPVERAGAALAGRGPFDLVLCDPPWPELDRALVALSRLLERAPLATGGRLVVEHPAQREVSVAGLAELDRRRWGDTAVTLFRPSVG